MATVIERLRASVTTKILFIGFLILVLLVPMGMIQDVIRDRQHRYESARQDVMTAWGRAQCLAGPVLIVPYRTVRIDEDGRRHEQIRRAFFLPERLAVRGNVETQMRRRGIYDVPVYTASLHLQGRFRFPDLAALDVPGSDVLWDKAKLALFISDPRTVKEPIALRSAAGDGVFVPGDADVDGLAAQLEVALPGLRAQRDAGGFGYELGLELGGTSSVRLLPFGDETQVVLTSSWTTPSFTGAYLPERHEIDAEGFTARWKILHLGRGYPSAWLGTQSPAKHFQASAFGVDLYVPVSTYQKATRAAKYAVLFIGLTFLAYFMLEVFCGLRLHPFQYLLVGFANCLFYLLLLSLSEHIGFAAAYAASAAGAVALVTGYSASILQTRARALLMLALLGVLYAFLYVTLRAEEHAMLMGSLLLFSILAVLMYVTRRIDWYRVSLGGGDGWAGLGADARGARAGS
ncbi:MAG: cell envelope integrity protein CreD [Gammaproteobacteria bacterium]|nr:cell envelope integrity protein CreD [Gammaproteobacteria bacterium]